MKETGEEYVNPTTSRSWLQHVIFVGKTVGGFGLLLWYFITPNPYFASQFATLSMSRGMPGQSPSEVEKGKQASTLEDARQESTIGATVESEASCSMLLPFDGQGWPTNPEEVRRTSSSAVSIERRESNPPETGTSSWDDPRSFSLGKIKEQEMTTDAPPVQQMTMGGAGTSSANLTQRPQAKAGKTLLLPRPLLPSTSPRGPAPLSSVRESNPEGFNPSQSPNSRRRCSPCSDSVFSCCQASFNSLRSPRRSPSLALSSPSPPVRAQQMTTLRRHRIAPTDQVSAPREWDDRSTDDLVQEFLRQPTNDERQRFLTSVKERQVCLK